MSFGCVKDQFWANLTTWLENKILKYSIQLHNICSRCDFTGSDPLYLQETLNFSCYHIFNIITYNQILGSWKENEVAGFDVFSQ